MKVLFTNKEDEVRYHVAELRNMGVTVSFLTDLNIGKEGISVKNKEEAISTNSFYHNISGLITITISEEPFLYDVNDKAQPKNNLEKINALSKEEKVQYYISLVRRFGHNGKLFGYIEKTVLITSNDGTYPFTYKVPLIYISTRLSNRTNSLDSIRYISSVDKLKTELNYDEYLRNECSANKPVFDFIFDVLNAIKNEKQKVNTYENNY